MPNPRRNSNPNNPFECHPQFQSRSLSLSSLIFFLKRPQAFPFLLSIFLFLTWVSLRFQKHQAPQHFNSQTQHQPEEVRKGDDVNANLVRFSSDSPSPIIKDKRGWLLNPVIAAKEAGVLGGAQSCVSAHVGEIRPGGVRGNHRHHFCNETIIIWGAKTKFRVGYKKNLLIRIPKVGPHRMKMNISKLRNSDLYLLLQDGRVESLGILGGPFVSRDLSLYQDMRVHCTSSVGEPPHGGERLCRSHG